MQPCVRHYFMKRWVSNMCFEKYFLCIFSHENKSSNCGDICFDFFLCCCYFLLRCKHCVRQFTNDTSSCKWMLELYIKDHQDICRKDNRDLDKAYIIVSDTWKQMCLWKPDIFTVIFCIFLLAIFSHLKDISVLVSKQWAYCSTCSTAPESH